MSTQTIPTITPTQLTRILSIAIADREPVMIVGAPGIGKSNIVAQAATAAAADVVYFHGVTSDPTDIKGLPWIAPDAAGQQRAEFLPFGDLRKLITATKPTVAFLDDLGQAPPAVQASFMQPVLARRIGETVISPYVMFVAATNRKQDKAGVSGILEPVKSRFSIYHLTPDLDAWCQWALAAGLPVEVVAFARFRPECIMDFQASADLTNSCSPRTLATAARWVSRALPPDLELPTLTSAIGEGRAAELYGFLRVWRSLPSIDEILLSPTTARVPAADSAGTLWALSGLLGRRATAGNMQAITQYVSRLPADNQVLVMKVISTRKRKPEESDPMHTQAFISWASAHPDIML